MAECHLCQGSVDCGDAYCRSCGAALNPIPTRVAQNGSGHAKRYKMSRRGMDRLLLAVASLAIAGSVLSIGLQMPPANSPLSTTMVLLDIQGKSLRENGSQFLLTRSPDNDGRLITSLRLAWSASGPLRLEVGSFAFSCRWLSMGGSDDCGNFEAAQADGERAVSLDSPYMGTIWISWRDGLMDGVGLDVYRLTITASLS